MTGVIVPVVRTGVCGAGPVVPVQPENAVIATMMRRIIQVVFRSITTGCPGDY
jgi:(2Fe-2S) ferredoxin